MLWRRIHRPLLCVLALVWHGEVAAQAPLHLEAKIRLPQVEGRLDHLAFDAARHRLFVAALGNGSIEVVDVGRRRVLHGISGLDEPQGVAYSPDLDLLYVASGGDGTLRVYRGADFSHVQDVDAGDDADNVRIDDTGQRVFVGTGSGSLAVFQAKTLERLADFALKGHPESFQLSPVGGVAFVNVPGAHEIAVLDRDGSTRAHWPTGTLHANYPMALDPAGRHVLVAFRQPATLAAYDPHDGSLLLGVPGCGDADDIFIDARRGRIYEVCGEGVVDILDRGSLARLGRQPTAAGARTGLYVPQADRLFVAVPAHAGRAAAIWIFAPR
jgi:hypothetical protein